MPTDAYTISQAQGMAELTAALEHKELQQQIDVLTARLDRGLAKIESARAKGVDVGQWEKLWLELEAQYRRTYDRLHGPA